jgi:purine-binding chemotaxis protein CheW
LSPIALPAVSAEAADKDVKLACLRVGSAFYALDIMGIREIIRPLPITEVPKAPSYVDGVITLRKAVIPVVDLRRRFGIEKKAEPRERIVICAVQGKIVGLVVDEVSEVATFSREDIRPAPYYMSGAEADFFPGVCRHNGRLLLLIDLHRILSSEQRIDADQIHQQALEGEKKD